MHDIPRRVKPDVIGWVYRTVGNERKEVESMEAYDDENRRDDLSDYGGGEVLALNNIIHRL